MSSIPRSSSTSVIVVDDHDLIGESLVMALRAQKRVAARRLRVRSEQQILKDLAAAGTGVVLLDLDLGHDAERRPIDGLQLVARLSANGWRVIIISGSRDRAHVAAAIVAGAWGYVPKSAPLPDLLRAVTDAVDGRPIMTETESLHWHELDRRARAVRARRDERLDRLAPREREVLDLLARGMRVAAIAQRFVVSEATVRTQVKSILRKLEVNSQIEAIAIHRAAGR